MLLHENEVRLRLLRLRGTDLVQLRREVHPEREGEEGVPEEEVPEEGVVGNFLLQKNAVLFKEFV